MRSPRELCLPVLAVIFLAAPALGQPATAKKGEPKMLADKVGWPIAITYYESPAGKESPVVILLHGDEGRGNRLVWDQFAQSLQGEGIAAIAVDLRKHGESVAPMLPTRLLPADFPAMVTLDLAAVKSFIYDEHQAEKLNMRKTGIVACDFSAPIAVNFTLQDWMKRPYSDAPTLAASTPRGQDVRAMVLISPEDKVTGVQTGREILALRAPLWNMAFLFANGSRDKKDRRTTEKMYEKVSKNLPEDAPQRMYHKEYDTAYRGTDLLGKGRAVPIEAHMLQFFKLHLKDLPDRWVDRKPRI